MAKFVFKRKACAKLAVEFRRASWGLGSFGLFLATYVGVGWAMAAAAVAWLGLQLLAFALDSLTND